MFLLKPARPAFSGSILVSTMILATVLVAGHSAVAADESAMLKLKPATHGSAPNRPRQVDLAGRRTLGGFI